MKSSGPWRKYWAARWWAISLALMVALVAVDTVYHLRTTWDLTWQHNPVPPAPDSSSPSGYANNQHVLILPYTGMDGYHWIMQTQQMLATGEARIRKVNYDNAPEGREVHWASALRWWMAGLAWIDHVYTGTPLPQAVEEIAPFASTLLVVLLIMLVAPFVARRFGPLPAALFAFGAVGVGPFYESFTEGRLDHHGLAALNALFSVLFLAGGAAGWVRSAPASSPDGGETPLPAWLPDRPQAKRWFIAAGIAGGVGLWISAASEAPVLVEIGLGALLATGLLGRGTDENDSTQPDPSLWRVWGWSGAAMSLFFYLLEYFPAHLGMRLEVNHPLYALAWAGGGEIIFRACRWWSGGKLAGSGRDWAWLVFGVFAVGAIPALVFIAPGKVFWVNDQFLWTMHNDYIEEFFGLGTFLKSQIDHGLYWTLIIMANPLVLLAVPMLFWSCLRSFPRPARALLLLALPPGLITFGLSVAQVRWTEINYSLWLAALVMVTIALQWHRTYRWTALRVTAAAMLLGWALLPSPVYMVKTWVQTGWKAVPSEVEQLELIVRDATLRLRARVGNESALVLSGPTSSTWLAYYGGFQTLGTYYWENLHGMQAAAAIYGATYDRAAQLILARHITHLVIFSFVDNPAEYARLSRGLRSTQPAPDDAFVWHMQNARLVPQWLQTIYYPMPSGDYFKMFHVFIYEVAPAQTTNEALARLAETQMENGYSVEAANLLHLALSRDPASLPALIALARQQLTSNQRTEFADTLQRLRLLAPTANALELGDRVDLAAVFSRTQDNLRVRDQMLLALRDANNETMRKLRPDSLLNLLYLARVLGQLDQHPGLWAVGLNLLPPSERLQLLIQSSDFEKSAGHFPEALALLRQALVIDPDSLMGLDRLILLLCASVEASVRNGKEALALAEHAYQIDQSKHVEITDALACAYAETGDFEHAVQFEQQAIAAAEPASPPSLVGVLRAHLALFQNRQPLRN